MIDSLYHYELAYIPFVVIAPGLWLPSSLIRLHSSKVLAHRTSV